MPSLSSASRSVLSLHGLLLLVVTGQAVASQTAESQIPASAAASSVPPVTQSNDPSAPPPDKSSAEPLPATKAVEAIDTSKLEFTPVPYLSKEPVREFKNPKWVINPANHYQAILSTEKGDITVELYSQRAPKAVNSFVFLALNHFYDGTRFHRVIEGFMAQGGDGLSADMSQQAAWGTGDPGYKYFYEINEDLNFNSTGVLGVARARSPHTQGSQFFITLAPANFLTGEYTIFGKVIAGHENLQKLTRNYNSSGPVKGKKADLLKTVKILVAQEAVQKTVKREDGDKNTKSEGKNEDK